jgi:ABC-type nitrate/sulfonate/bicarbonate transport system substrate-binding protein
LIERDPQLVAKMVRIMRRTLQWIASHTPEELLEKLDIRDPAERVALLACLKKHPRLYSRDGRFPSRRLQETEIFFRATAKDHSAAQALKADSVVNDKWVGRSR